MILAFDNVGFAYPGRPPVLRHFSLTVARGEVVVLVGRSGAGKTTVLKLVNQLLLPSAGSVLVEGRSTRDWDAIQLRRRSGYVFQDVGLFPHMSVEENVRIVPRLEGWDTARAHARASELLDLVGLPSGEFGRRRPHELSGGQRQRVGLARALATDPPVLLMDEPFGALDPVTRVEVRRSFLQIQNRLKTSTILVTHDMREAFELAGRIGLLDEGELIALGSRHDISSSRDPRVQAFVESAFPRRPESYS